MRQPRAELGAELRRYQPAGHGRIHVTNDDNPVGLTALENRREGEHYLRGLVCIGPGTNTEVEIRLGYLQVAKEGIGHLRVVMLAGVYQDTSVTGCG